VKRVLIVCLLALGVLVSGTFAAAAPADTTPVPTNPVPTTPGPVMTDPAAPAASDALPAGVRVAGVAVGGLAPADAVAAVQTAFGRPLEVVVDAVSYRLDPSTFALAYAAAAVNRARAASGPARVPLVVAVRGAAIRSWVASLRARLQRAAHTGTLVIRDGRPTIVGATSGRILATAPLTEKLVAALTHNSRLPIRVHTRTVTPMLGPSSAGPIIVINRTLNRLSLFDGTQLVRRFPVATGQAIYPTPKGDFKIVVKQVNPWWYPPVNDTWAKGLKPVPPGPDNPLGTRWMGLSAPGIGIHGTDSPSSIGYSASHGCIRMQVPDAEWLFEQVDVGTPVFIV
jgi:lipoprotein-anchoring transpeptidase ErfK/SrfK